MQVAATPPVAPTPKDVAATQALPTSIKPAHHEKDPKQDSDSASNAIAAAAAKTAAARGGALNVVA
jgi:hypothetical protein